MFRYVNLPRDLAYYLREFSFVHDERTEIKYTDPSTIFKFAFALCCPFFSKRFLRARMAALAIAECTNSADQIARVLSKITGAFVRISRTNEECLVGDSKATDTPIFPFGTPGVYKGKMAPYSKTANDIVINVNLNGATKSEFESYLPLLIPFYVKFTIKYN